MPRFSVLFQIKPWLVFFSPATLFNYIEDFCSRRTPHIAGTSGRLRQFARFVTFFLPDY